jgi:hypothetical protein
MKPVCEGGGQVGIEGFRTLCTACHQKETNQIHRRKKAKKLSNSAVGTSDIRSFFGGK